MLGVIISIKITLLSLSLLDKPLIYTLTYLNHFAIPSRKLFPAENILWVIRKYLVLQNGSKILFKVSIDIICKIQRSPFYFKGFYVSPSHAKKKKKVKKLVPSE